MTGPPYAPGPAAALSGSEGLGSLAGVSRDQNGDGRREAPGAAAAALRLHARLLESMGEGVSVSDEAGVIVYTNPAEDRMFGYAPGELVGRHVSVQNAYPPEENARRVAEVIAELRARGRWEGEWRNVRKDGTPFVTRARITALELDGRPHWVCVQEDVTERRAAEAALRESEARARLAVEAAQLGTWTWDLATDAATFDARVRELFEFPDDAPQPRAEILASRVHPEDRTRVAALLAAAADPAGDGRYDATYRVVRPDGTERWALAAGQMTFAGEGAARRPVSLFGTVRDVTAQHAAEAAARAAEARFRAVQDASPDGSVLVESVREGGRPDGRIVDFVYTYVNPAAERLTGRRAADMLGRRVLDLFPHVVDEGLFDAYGRVVETGTPFVTETEYRHDGMDHGLRVTVVKVGDGFHIQFADVSERVRAAREAARAREAAERERERATEARAAAEAANAAKSQFLATMSHELRTPLNAIQGYVQLLAMELHGPATPQQQEAFGRIDRAQRHLLGLIHDILSYARIESGRVEYDVDAVDAAAVVRDVLPLVEPQLAAKGLALDVRVPAGAPGALVWADREKLAQVLLNLLSNAVKFTPEGGRVTVELTDRADGTGPADLAFLRVADTGVGIPRDKLEAVFEPFVQVRGRGAYTPGQGGTGLGLAISRDLARGMGGDLTAESTPGAGSTFTLTLPTA